jgi:hypothetical protein
MTNIFADIDMKRFMEEKTYLVEYKFCIYIQTEVNRECLACYNCNHNYLCEQIGTEGLINYLKDEHTEYFI